MSKIDVYKDLATRNGWIFSMDKDSNRPYFMKNGNYAVPDSQTSEEDKELLASIISEGSDELKRIALMCWDNDVLITGPCSGIREYHIENPIALHLGLIAPSEVILPLQQKLSETMPTIDHYIRKQDDKIRYDISYIVEEPGLSKEQSEEIFKEIADQLAEVLGTDDKKTATKK